MGVPFPNLLSSSFFFQLHPPCRACRVDGERQERIWMPPFFLSGGGGGHRQPWEGCLPRSSRARSQRRLRSWSWKPWSRRPWGWKLSRPSSMEYDPHRLPSLRVCHRSGQEAAQPAPSAGLLRGGGGHGRRPAHRLLVAGGRLPQQIGRASCRERVYVLV